MFTTAQTPKALRPYQSFCLDAIEHARVNGLKRMTVVLPPGTGKTFIFAHHLARRGGRALVVAHRSELLEQAKATMLQVFPHTMQASIRILSDDAASAVYTAQIVLASVQSLLNPTTRARLGHFDTIIIDEAHHYTAAAWATISGWSGEPTFICFTGTPLRGDGVWAPAQIGPVIYSQTTRWAIANGYLSDVFDYGQVEAPSNLEELADFAQGAWFEHQGVVVVYCASVEQSDALAAVLTLRGGRAASINWETDPLVRAGVIRAAKAGEIQVLCNVALLTEGFDLPMITAVILARTVRSAALMGQIAGRCMRPAPGKTAGYVYRLGITASDTAVVDGFLGTPRQWLRDATVFRQVSVKAACAAREKLPFAGIIRWWEGLTEDAWITGH